MNHLTEFSKQKETCILLFVIAKKLLVYFYSSSTPNGEPQSEVSHPHQEFSFIHSVDRELVLAKILD